MPHGPCGTERRRFFRVHMDAPVAIEVLSEHEADSHREMIERGGEHVFNASFDARINTLLNTLKSRDPVAAELIKLVNKKLNLLIAENGDTLDINDSVACSMQRINLSACGAAVLNEDAIDAGALVRFHLMLRENRLVLLARVVACDDIRKMYRWRLNFEGLSHADEEALIQFVMETDAKIRRAKMKG